MISQQDNFALKQPERILRLLSYNIQAGITTGSYHHYLTHSWKHILPFRRREENLQRIASLIREYDIVGLQEVDGGSLRSNYVNQVEHLAKNAHFPFWYQQLNRNLGRLAQHSNGFLSRYRPKAITEHKLPGLIPGRGAIVARFGKDSNPLVLIILHLALSKRAQYRQLDHVCEMASDYQNVILMGDLNCPSRALEDHPSVRQADLYEPLVGLNTFPSWQPKRNLDHILVTPSLAVSGFSVLDYSGSDHLPISIDINLPNELELG